MMSVWPVYSDYPFMHENMPTLSSGGEVEQFMLIIQSALVHIYEVLL